MSSRIALIAALLAAGPALASGSTPPLPLPTEELGTYAICLNNLTSVHRLDIARIDTAPVTRDDGSVLRRTLRTDGVIETGPEAAIYRAEYGVTVSAPDAASGQIRHQYSWDRVEYACTGGTLTGARSQGFSSPSFEPAD